MNTTFALGTANQTRCMHKITETTKFWGVDVGDFQDQGTTAATAQTEGDSNKRAPPSHSALCIKLDACLKSRKPRSFGGVDVGDFPDLENTVATARTNEDSDKRTPPSHSAP